MRKAIIDRQVQALAEHGLDAMVSCSPENYAYATGFVVPSQPLIRHRHAMVIVTADARTELFSVDMEASTVKRRDWNESRSAPNEVLWRSSFRRQLDLQRRVNLCRRFR